MKFQVVTEKGYHVFEADEIFCQEGTFFGRKDGKNVALVSRENVFCIIPQE